MYLESQKYLDQMVEKIFSMFLYSVSIGELELSDLESLNVTFNGYRKHKSLFK